MFTIETHFFGAGMTIENAQVLFLTRLGFRKSPRLATGYSKVNGFAKCFRETGSAVCLVTLVQEE